MGDLNPCVKCGRVPVSRTMGVMAIVKCRPPARGYGNNCNYRYGKTFAEAEARWNEGNPLSTPTDPPPGPVSREPGGET